ncbi:hypothetical protein BB559_005882 [Furculomyces boomerangus]|uniref:DUF4112 domain-containing protein n=2 Tax=Harpellales TaxID=61421 RepID=A0A2T9Y5Z9_9FUNG|nr:hypothetical protein BB559_005882 [Furculomyces boomerangus]PVZ97158.1 hypothetical protein BB558_006891 [Smittium angustum]
MAQNIDILIRENRELTTESLGKPGPKPNLNAEGLPNPIEKQILKSLKKQKKMAINLDSVFSFCGIRFGWDPVIGLIPIIGDFGGTVLGTLFILAAIKRFNPSFGIILLMVINVILDMLVGIFPVIGDFVDVLFKANLRNYNLIEKHVMKKHQISELPR